MSQNLCGENEELILLLRDIYSSSNASSNKYASAVNRDQQGSCINGYGSETNLTDAMHKYQGNYLFELLDIAEGYHIQTFGMDLYAYTTPFIICIGLLGNLASMFVFLTKRLRRLSASLYLAALSASDSLVLITYVLLQWLQKGLPHWPGNHSITFVNINGFCHAFLFISYSFRFISVYLIVVFTIERYIAVCKPLQRRMICTKNFARKLIVLVHVMGAAISLYKPVLSGVYNPGSIVQDTHPAHMATEGPDTIVLDSRLNHTFNTLPSTKNQSGIDDAWLIDPDELKEDNIGDNGVMNDGIMNDKQFIVTKTCMRNPEYNDINFVMELVYGLLITAIPFVLMSFFNFMIMRKLIRRFRDKNKLQMSFRENKIRWEFTIMLLTVSSCFICLNMPYFVIWVQQFVNTFDTSDPVIIQRLSNQLLITKTIFNLNYCINFVVYCMTGSYYRGVIKDWFLCCCCCPKSISIDAKQRMHANGYISARKASNSISMSTQGTFV